MLTNFTKDLLAIIYLFIYLFISTDAMTTEHDN